MRKLATWMYVSNYNKYSVSRRCGDIKLLSQNALVAHALMCNGIACKNARKMVDKPLQYRCNGLQVV